jgi:hypothetical protein
MIAAMTLLLAGCGYSSKSLYTTAYKTVHVSIFDNKTFRKEVEFRLTEAVDKNIEARTPYKLSSDKKYADTILTATIVDIQELPLSRRYQTNLPRETQIVITVDFSWRDAKTGRQLVQEKAFHRGATEIPELGERIGDAQQLAIEELAYAIVSQMQKDF